MLSSPGLTGYLDQVYLLFRQFMPGLHAAYFRLVLLFVTFIVIVLLTNLLALVLNFYLRLLLAFRMKKLTSKNTYHSPSNTTNAHPG